MFNPKSNLLFFGPLVFLALGCATNNSTVGVGGSQSTTGSNESSEGGKSTGKGGATQKTDAGDEGGAGDSEASSTSKGGSGTRTSAKTGATGGKSSSGSKSSAGGTKADGGASASQGGGDESGSGGQDTSATTPTGPGAYALPPPSQCHNQDYVSYESGCREGEASSTCGGKCQVINACLESNQTKKYADVTFICPRFMLFSPEMIQAAKDDGNDGFNYAIVGHDVDGAGIDGAGTQSTCCQCYQLVYAYPSPHNDKQCLVNPDDTTSPKSAIPVPPPLIVQSFNTAATPQTFDVYMGAGGLGANNACAKLTIGGQEAKSVSGEHMYTAYPSVGQPGNGGVKPVTHWDAECKTSDTRWVTEATFTSEACQNKVEATCNEMKSDIPGLTELGRESCIRSNSPETPYHLNWSVYAMKVECPEHLTQVTGCKLAPQGLPAVKKNITTGEQAAGDDGFKARANGGSDLYETTTMEDCCRPSCAARDWIEKKGLKPDGLYNSFYSCDGKGVPITEKE